LSDINAPDLKVLEAQAKGPTGTKGGVRLRAGAHVLSMLSVPLNVHVLQALDNGPMPLIDLRRAVGSPPQTTMRGHLRALTQAGVIERRRHSGFPGPVDYELARPGKELLGVAALLEAWLLGAPDGPIQLGSVAAKSSTKALAEGWSSGIVRALAAKPLALTELSRLITGLSYPSLERRLGAMRIAGLIERCPGSGRGTPYAVTEWLRRAIAPLAAGARWERKHLPKETAPIRRIDIEAAFLLVLPLVVLPVEQSGICRLAVDTSNGLQHRQAGVVVEVDEGRVTSCVTRLEGDADASALGSAAAWIQAVIERDSGRLELGGRRPLAMALGDGLHRALFS
jgi:DNA-binding HxlR family transcriptional regulator